ncbi:hypothetical protein GUA87_03530 [Sneathiella sp. P13V-1]|uniref:ExbD/TolR family protein n=1 Tax=Sneathiella sp. P13V-1 TaxID=2697366 RepID=UPI00187B3600|nr:biopolymer transporter ExbD [Sneathiella sp. P13V-1]MBE7635900.1 hypothetical protein [Sneathiella sp. P13V-1]
MRRRRGLSLAPLIDVIFILLIFFMLVSQLDTHSVLGLIQNHYENETISSKGSHMNQNIIRLKSTGEIQFRGRSVPMDRIEAVFSADGFLEEGTALFIRMDGDVTVQMLVSLIAELEKVGGLQYSLIEEAPKS